MHHPTTFALGTFASAQKPFPAIVIGDRAFDLRSHEGPEVTLRGLLENWDASLTRLRALAGRLAGHPGQPLSELQPLPPVDPPGQVFQAGANYHRHVLDLIAAAEERGDTSDGLRTTADRAKARLVQEERAHKGSPFVFLGSAHGMVGATDDIVLPVDSEQPDWEIELAAVIGRQARRIGRDQARDVIAGYTICNDVTSRDALHRADDDRLGIDWLAAKGAPTFLPTGPLLVPAEFVPAPMNLRLCLRVNGRTMQDATTAEMLFDIASLVAYISTVAELRPGDLVLTGSPAGNGASHGCFLRPGDVIEAEIDGLGSQRNRCVAEPPTGQRRDQLVTAVNRKGVPDE